jgi:multiple sugar transport system substrate-binding protein
VSGTTAAGGRRAATGHLLVALVVALVTAGCGESGAARDGPRRLVFKYGKISAPPGLMRDLLDEFHRENPSVTVDAEMLPSSTDQQHQYYAINLEGGYGGIDVMALDVIWVQEFARAAWIEDLTGRWPAADRADFLDGPLAVATWRGRVHAVPWYVDAGVLYYREDLLARYGIRPPRTLDELAAAARTVMDGERRPGLYGFLWQGKQYEGLVCAVLELMRGLGGDVLDSKGNVVLDDPASLRAMARVRALLEAGGVTPAIVTTLDEEASRILFMRGDAVFLRNWPYAWTLFQERDSPVRGKVGIGPVPGGVPTLGGWQLAINRASRHKDMAWRLIEYLSRPRVQRRIAIEAGLKPPRRSLYADRELAATQPFIGRLLPLLEGARPRPVSPYYLMISEELKLELSAAVSGIRPPDEALRRAARRLRRILAMDQGEPAGP